ncbi:HAD-IIA family hydrolase [Natronococcus sp. A-GB7]|uniref:HAD-IIA family hydrolase n=1 Tax=Natronococcus sp. A-GB7 TaxID=3037649 RepID=UPI00241F3F80|nr:HAD-IIA family hydrolase [Natronococcus sp. A-GB7]MDG5819416.1 HAD-IIA family hydrolase [Natronococcus sp. A-GB7]
MDGAIVDLDGTVYRSHTAVPGATEGIELLRDAGVDIVFVTNSSTKTREECRDRLASLGIETAVSDILTSASVTATYVTREYPTATVLAVGEPAVTDELTRAGATLTDDPAEADVLVVGKDTAFDFDTLTRCLRAIESGAAFIGTNDDRKVPTDSGLVPGAGALLAAVSYASDRDPDVVCGKPNDPIIEVSLDTLETDPADCLVIGDNPETDIEMGRRAGLTTVLVLTGLVDGSDPLLAEGPADHVIASLAEVSTVLRES